MKSPQHRCKLYFTNLNRASLPMVALISEKIKSLFGSLFMFACVAAVALSASAFLILQELQPCDDAYITFRHSKNLAESFTPAWNHSGQRVLGSTTPAFLFALAVFAGITGNSHFDQAALHLNSCFLFLIVIFSYLVMKDLTKKEFPALLAAALIGFDSFSIFVFSQGFENAMLSLVMLSGLFLLRTGCLIPGVVLVSLAPLIRPEGIVLTPLAWGYIFLTRNFQKKLLLFFLAIPLFWFAFSTAYYGSCIPHPIKAKKKFPAIYKPYRNREVDLVMQLKNIVPNTAKVFDSHAKSVLFTGTLSDKIEAPMQKTKMWIAAAGLPFLILFFLIKPDGRIIYLLYPPLFIIFYAWIGRQQSWYFPSYIIFSTILLFSGCSLSIQALLTQADKLIFRKTHAKAAPTGIKKTGKKKSRRNTQKERAAEKPESIAEGGWLVRPWVLEVLCTVVFALFIATNYYTFNIGKDADPDHWVVFARDPRGEKWETIEELRYDAYRRAAEYINARAEKPGVALISEVGFFGYYYKGDVLDTVGLCSPEALTFYPPPDWDIKDKNGGYRTWANNFTPTNLVMKLKPDYVVNSTVYIANLFQDRSSFLREYVFVTEQGVAWGNPVAIFKRIEKTSR